MVFSVIRNDLLDKRSSKKQIVKKGGDMMETLPFHDEDLLNLFDSFCKKVLKLRSYSIFRNEEKERKKGVIYFSENEDVFNQIYMEDDYGILYFWLKIDGLTVAIGNELLYRSLLLLPNKKLIILILSFLEHSVKRCRISRIFE